MTVVNATSAGQLQRSVADSGRQHTVQHGDTLSGIARQAGVSLSALRAANPQVLNPNVIYPGDRIAIPGAQAQVSGGGRAQQADQPAASTAPVGRGDATRLSMADYQRAAGALGVDVATVRAVAEVESTGGGFLADGRPKILFERHVFARETGGRYNQSHPGISGPAGGYGASGANQHLRFEQAFALNPTAAMKSASWGEFQIMGFNHKMVGYESVGKFVEAMRSSAGNQLDAFVKFIDAAGLKGDLQNRNWAGFARGYNGPGYARNNYDSKMAAAYAKFAGSNPPPVATSRPGATPPSVTSPSATAPSPASPAAGSYAVRAGDTLSGIAQRHGVSLGALRAANPQIRNIHLIFPGQTIKVPGGGQTAASSHTVRSGDTLGGIAQQHGVSLAALSAANPQIRNIHLIHPGQTIHIPGAAAGSTAGNPTSSPVPAGGGTRVDGPAPASTASSSNAAAIAQKYLGWWAGDLKVSGHLPMNPNVPNTVNCANFVSAVLQKAGLINFHTDLVTGSNSGVKAALGTMLMARGWTKVPASQARPGDVAIVNNGGHTELVHSNINGKITLIGSNNTQGGSGPQRVSYGNPFGNAWYLTPPRK